MIENTPKTPPSRPPPIPPDRRPPMAAAKSAGGGQGLAKVKAFVAIRRIRIAAAWHGLLDWAGRRKLAAALAGAAVVAAAAIAIAFAFDVVPDVALFSPKTVADARENARSHPNDAAAQRDLGHALWASKRRQAAVAAYGRALALDASVADPKMVDNLVACFGHKEQHEAESLIWKNKLVAAEPKLEPLVRSRRPAIRWGAVHTLDRVGKGSKANWETAYIVDLDSNDCDVRRRAVDKLGAIGTKRSVAALRSAKADDEKTGGWFRSRCLGGRIDDAEQKILARR